jgi:hypothetical protein
MLGRKIESHARPELLREIIEHYATCFRARTGQPFLISWARDCAQLKPVLDLHGAATLRALIDAFFDGSPDDCSWVRDRVFGLPVFISVVNSLAGRLGASPIAIKPRRSRTVDNEAAGREAHRLFAEIRASR